MEILHLIDIPWWSGLSSYAFDCLRAHADSGHRVALACQEGSLCQRKALALGMQTLPMGGRGAGAAPRNFFAVGKRLAARPPQWIVAHTGSTHWIAWSWGRLLGVPVIRTRATAQPAKTGALNQRIYSQSRWIVTASEKLRQECLVRFSCGLESRLRTIAPPVDPPTAGSAPNGRLRIGLVARLDPVKGCSDFLQAARKVQAAFPDAEFHIAGAEENISWSALAGEARSLGLKNAVYHGFLPPDGVADLMRSCAFGVIASRGSEEVSRALLEWMAAGKAVVATAVGGIPEVLQDGVGGFLTPPSDPERLAEKILALLNRPELAQEMGRLNARQCAEKFSRAAFRARWDELLRDGDDRDSAGA